MNRSNLLSAVIAGMASLLANAVRADVPAPPVNQSIGMRDVLYSNLTEPECRGCHSSGVPDRHHLLYGKPIPPGSHVPYPDGDHDGVPDTTYQCVNCHAVHSATPLVRDCVVCHTGLSPHHDTAAARARHCKQCHGSLVDNYDDGHYIPTYSPSLVTPRVVDGEGQPMKHYNGIDQGAGACGYCHDDTALGMWGFSEYLPSFVTLHHDSLPDGDWDSCAWCHEGGFGDAHDIRLCEACHGPKSLHNIQADSPKAPTGTVVVGGELAGYGHVGRDAGPSDSDCWGCHGFKFAAVAPGSGPTVPTVYGADRTVIVAGTDATLVLTGASFVSTMGNTVYEAAVKLTADDGSSVTLQPEVVADEGMLAVTIPGTTAPGNYRLRALKVDLASNPAVISVVPKARISRATSVRKTVTITGSGFAGYAAGLGTSVTGTTSKGRTVKGTIVSWKEGKIVANFSSLPSRVTVSTVYGRATSSVR